MNDDLVWAIRGGAASKGKQLQTPQHQMRLKHPTNSPLVLNKQYLDKLSKADRSETKVKDMLGKHLSLSPAGKSTSHLQIGPEKANFNNIESESAKLSRSNNSANMKQLLYHNYPNTQKSLDFSQDNSHLSARNLGGSFVLPVINQKRSVAEQKVFASVAKQQSKPQNQSNILPQNLQPQQILHQSGDHIQFHKYISPRLQDALPSKIKSEQSDVGGQKKLLLKQPNNPDSMKALQKKLSVVSIRSAYSSSNNLKKKRLKNNFQLHPQLTNNISTGNQILIEEGAIRINQQFQSIQPTIIQQQSHSKIKQQLIKTIKLSKNTNFIQQLPQSVDYGQNGVNTSKFYRSLDSSQLQQQISIESSQQSGIDVALIMKEEQALRARLNQIQSQLTNFQRSGSNQSLTHLSSFDSHQMMPFISDSQLRTRNLNPQSTKIIAKSHQTLSKFALPKNSYAFKNLDQNSSQFQTQQMNSINISLQEEEEDEGEEDEYLQTTQAVRLIGTENIQNLGVKQLSEEYILPQSNRKIALEVEEADTSLTNYYKMNNDSHQKSRNQAPQPVFSQSVDQYQDRRTSTQDQELSMYSTIQSSKVKPPLPKQSLKQQKSLNSSVESNGRLVLKQLIGKQNTGQARKLTNPSGQQPVVYSFQRQHPQLQALKQGLVQLDTTQLSRDNLRASSNDNLEEVKSPLLQIPSATNVLAHKTSLKSNNLEFLSEIERQGTNMSSEFNRFISSNFNYKSFLHELKDINSPAKQAKSKSKFGFKLQSKSKEMQSKENHSRQESVSLEHLNKYTDSIHENANHQMIDKILLDQANNHPEEKIMSFVNQNKIALPSLQSSPDKSSVQLVIPRHESSIVESHQISTPLDQRGDSKPQVEIQNDYPALDFQSEIITFNFTYTKPQIQQQSIRTPQNQIIFESEEKKYGISQQQEQEKRAQQIQVEEKQFDVQFDSKNTNFSVKQQKKKQGNESIVDHIKNTELGQERFNSPQQNQRTFRAYQISERERLREIQQSRDVTGREEEKAMAPRGVRSRKDTNKTPSRLREQHKQKVVSQELALQVALKQLNIKENFFKNRSNISLIQTCIMLYKEMLRLNSYGLLFRLFKYKILKVSLKALRKFKVSKLRLPLYKLQRQNSRPPQHISYKKTTTEFFVNKKRLIKKNDLFFETPHRTEHSNRELSMYSSYIEDEDEEMPMQANEAIFWFKEACLQIALQALRKYQVRIIFSQQGSIVHYSLSIFREMMRVNHFGLMVKLVKKRLVQLAIYHYFQYEKEIQKQTIMNLFENKIMNMVIQAYRQKYPLATQRVRERLRLQLDGKKQMSQLMIQDSDSFRLMNSQQSQSRVSQNQTNINDNSHRIKHSETPIKQNFTSSRIIQAQSSRPLNEEVKLDPQVQQNLILSQESTDMTNDGLVLKIAQAYLIEYDSDEDGENEEESKHGADSRRSGDDNVTGESDSEEDQRKTPKDTKRTSQASQTSSNSFYATLMDQINNIGNLEKASLLQLRELEKKILSNQAKLKIDTAQLSNRNVPQEQQTNLNHQVTTSNSNFNNGGGSNVLNGVPQNTINFEDHSEGAVVQELGTKKLTDASSASAKSSIGKIKSEMLKINLDSLNSTQHEQDQERLSQRAGKKVEQTSDERIKLQILQNYGSQEPMLEESSQESSDSSQSQRRKDGDDSQRSHSSFTGSRGSGGKQGSSDDSSDSEESPPQLPLKQLVKEDSKKSINQNKAGVPNRNSVQAPQPRNTLLDQKQKESLKNQITTQPKSNSYQGLIVKQQERKSNQGSSTSVQPSPINKTGNSNNVSRISFKASSIQFNQGNSSRINEVSQKFSSSGAGNKIANGAQSQVTQQLITVSNFQAPLSNNGSNTASVFNTTNFIHNAVDSDKRASLSLNIKAIKINSYLPDNQKQSSDALPQTRMDKQAIQKDKISAPEDQKTQSSLPVSRQSNHKLQGAENKQISKSEKERSASAKKPKKTVILKNEEIDNLFRMFKDLDLYRQQMILQALEPHLRNKSKQKKKKKQEIKFKKYSDFVKD